MSDSPTLGTISVLFDGGPIGDDRYHLAVEIGDEDFDVGAYPTSGEAGEAMHKWLRDRRLTTAPGSAARVAHAIETNAALVVLDIVRQED